MVLTLLPVGRVAGCGCSTTLHLLGNLNRRLAAIIGAHLGICLRSATKIPVNCRNLRFDDEMQGNGRGQTRTRMRSFMLFNRDRTPPSPPKSLTQATASATSLTSVVPSPSSAARVADEASWSPTRLSISFLYRVSGSLRSGQTIKVDGENQRGGC